MEQFNAKIFAKYENLKKRKGFVEEELILKTEADLRDYRSAVEDLVEALKNENDRLRVEISSMQDQYYECQKLLLEESQKTKELSNEVGKLQSLLLQKDDSGNALVASPYTCPVVRPMDISRNSPTKKTANEPLYVSPLVRSRDISKIGKTPNSWTGQNTIQYKEATAFSSSSHQEDQIVSAFCLFGFYSDHGYESFQPDCCRRNTAGNASGKGCGSCVFQTLVESIVGMRFSIGFQAEGPCLSVIHEMSGYTFSLTWIRHEDAEGELVYHVFSLGTLERVALDWMKEDIVFSMTMCPGFFEKISRVIGHH